MTGRIRDRIEHSLDLPVLHRKGEALEINLAAGGEARQGERVGEAAVRIAQNRKWKRKPGHQLALIVGGLTAQTEQPDAEREKPGMTVAKAFELGRRAVRASDFVPIRRIGTTRTAGPGIDDQEATPGQRRDVDRAAVRRRQRKLRQGPELEIGLVFLGL